MYNQPPHLSLHKKMFPPIGLHASGSNDPAAKIRTIVKICLQTDLQAASNIILHLSLEISYSLPTIDIASKKKPTYKSYTIIVSGLINIMLLSVSQPLLYISFCKKRCHKALYYGDHHFSDTQNTFDL